MRLRRSRCEHRWVPRAVTHDLSYPPDTTVLHVCTVCGDAKTERLKGLWKVVDLVVATDDDIQRVLTKKKGKEV